MTVHHLPLPPKVTVYVWRRNRVTKTVLDDLTTRGITHTVVSLRRNPNQLHRIRRLGYGLLDTPIVTAGDMHWAGYQPHRHDQLCDALTAWTRPTPVRDTDL